MDLQRVGVTGWSFGGYLSALAVMKRPEVFHVGVAGAPVVDWTDYDTFYTERYLNLPDQNHDGYKASSLLTYAPSLTRPLLLVHGTSDDNVYFFHTMKLVDALFRAGRPFQLLPLAGFTHMVPDPVVTEQLWTRIVAHLTATLKP
jgi:dipeptidyl-peptidase-4